MKKRDKYILLVSPCNKRADVWLGRELDLRKRQEEDDGGSGGCAARFYHIPSIVFF